uniref:(northern house mosquito) hypothetical protein n=1 Tax=Culex pipiens TaxID=7175 RepID=A0A8D8P9V2_CULPI
MLPGEGQPARVHGLLLPVLLDGGHLRNAGNYGLHAGQRWHLPADRGEGPPVGKCPRCPVTDALLRHVRLFRRVCVQSGTSGQIRSVRRCDACYPQRYGHLHVVTSAGPARQQLPRCAILRGTRQHLQLSPVRQPQARLQQEGSPPSSVRNQGPFRGEPPIFSRQRRRDRSAETQAVRNGHYAVGLRWSNRPPSGLLRGSPRVRQVPS